MFIRLQHGETRQNLNIWVYGEKSLARGSGLFIPETGVAANHHFLPPSDKSKLVFSHGSYSLDIFVKEVGKTLPYQISKIKVDLSPEMATGLAQSRGYGVYFDWGPDSGCYYSHLRPPPPAELSGFLRDMLSPKVDSTND